MFSFYLFCLFFLVILNFCIVYLHWNLLFWILINSLIFLLLLNLIFNNLILMNLYQWLIGIRWRIWFFIINGNLRRCNLSGWLGRYLQTWFDLNTLIITCLEWNHVWSSLSTALIRHHHILALLKAYKVILTCLKLRYFNGYILLFFLLAIFNF